MAAAVAPPGSPPTEHQDPFYPKFVYQQPVPWSQIPHAPGNLPSWDAKLKQMEEERKREEEEERQRRAEEEEARRHETPTLSSPSGQPKQGAAVAPAASPNNRRQASTGSSPGFLSSLRSASSSSRHLPSTQSTTSFRGPTSELVEYDSHGGIRAKGAPDPASGGKGTGKGSKNPLLRFIQRRFSALQVNGGQGQTRKAKEHRGGIQGGPNGITRTDSRGRAILTKPAPGSGANTGKASGVGGAKKTRSNAFAEKMKITSGKAVQKLSTTWQKLNSKSPKDQLPKTWDDWRKAYARVCTSFFSLSETCRLMV